MNIQYTKDEHLCQYVVHFTIDGVMRCGSNNN